MAQLTSTRTTTAGPPRPTVHPAAGIVRSVLHRGWVVAIGLAVLWGVAAALVTPRSPQTTAAALTSVLVSLAVGVGAGVLTQSRWAVLVAPVVFAVAFELARMPVDGPTVDAPHLSRYGVFALVVGRGFHALLSLLPMSIGAAWGAFALARRHGDVRAGRGRSRPAVDGRDGIRGPGRRGHARRRPTGHPRLRSPERTVSRCPGASRS